jgi:hypothetical protein
MLLNSTGKPYTEEELTPPDRRTPCSQCGSVARRAVHKGFARHWRLTCQQCGYELATGRGELPEGEV